MTSALFRGSKRARVAHALDLLGLLDGLLGLRSRLGTRTLLVLTYHRLADPGSIGDLDDEVCEADASSFADQLAMLQSYGTLVTLADVRRFFQGCPIPKNPILLSFDDGYRECLDVALPALIKAGATATFFVTTGYPDAGRLFWWDRISLLLRRAAARSMTLCLPEPIHLDLAKDRAGAKRTLLRLVKRTRGLDPGFFMDELSRATGVSLDPAEERAIAARTILGFSEIRALRDAGMSVASHSHEHRVLTTMTPAAAHEDLARSRRVLSEVLDEDVRALAYPVGHRLEGPALRAAKDAGFNLGFTNATGTMVFGRDEPMNVPRVAVNPGRADAMFKAMLLLGNG